MDKELIIILFIIQLQFLTAEVVYSDPNFATELDSITVYFNAAEGDQGLMGFTGNIWAHTGVITENSTDPSDWRYVKTNWGQNTNETQLTPLGNNLWKLNIGYPHVYYGVPNGEQILQLAFVFRNNDGSVSGRGIGGADIFLDLYDTGVTIIIISPYLDHTFGDQRRAPLFGFTTDTIEVVITGAAIGSEISTLNLYWGDSSQVQTSNDTLFTEILLQEFSLGMQTFNIVANDTSGLADSSSFYVMIHDQASENQRPSNINDGITYYEADPTSVTLSLFSPYKEFVYVIGDFNNWFIDENYYMEKDSGSADSVHFWITLDNLSPGTEYAFQYLVDGEIRIAEPYADKVLDKWNDQHINSQIYPNLKPYPFGKTDHIVSILQTAQNSFNWQHSTTFERPEKDQLIIYELLVRDFITSHDFQTLIDTLNYLEDLGINAIQIMPFNEFEGNSSWGYNSSFYFAPDKYYGPKDALKSFIDECHLRGIAVIMDIVLNHTYSQSPFVRLYNEGDWGSPTIENPWYNTQSNFTNPDAQWGNDLNHESIHTKRLVDRINHYWLEEYKIDGFRFDFSKGFGNNIKGSDDPWGSEYDTDRIGLLKRMADEIWDYDSSVYVILEHFAENSEEEELADYGMLLWGNSSYNYAETAMGYHTNGKSDFSWGYFGIRGWNNAHLVTYYESHDEERLMYKNLTWGHNTGNYNIQELNTALNRIKGVGSFFFTIPGPKMIWQFGELGYDVSIDDPCRLCEKPILWDYFQENGRRNLYKTFQALIHLRMQYPVFHSATTEVDLSVGSSTGKKRIRLNHSDMKAIIIGNFNVVGQTINPQFFNTGIWYDYFSGDSIEITDLNETIYFEAGEFHIYTDSYIYPPETGILVNDYESTRMPDKVSLDQNYPNPFNPSTSIRFYVETISNASLELFDINGKLVDTLVDKMTIPGEYNIVWDGSAYSSGIYIARLNSGSKSKSVKMLLLK